MAKDSVLFICTHNSARSQMAEAYLKRIAGEDFIVESAGLEPGKLNPAVVAVLKEDGINISDKKPQSVFDLFKSGKTYHYVITVCDKEAEEKCPTFPGMHKKELWPFPDPSSFTGTQEEILEQTREVRDAVKKRIEEYIRKKNRRIPRL